MTTWFLIVTFIGTTDAKMSPFATEQECKAAMKITQKYLKNVKDVASIECLEGSILKENGVKPEDKEGVI